MPARALQPAPATAADRSPSLLFQFPLLLLPGHAAPVVGETAILTALTGAPADAQWAALALAAAPHAAALAAPALGERDAAPDEADAALAALKELLPPLEAAVGKAGPGIGGGGLTASDAALAGALAPALFAPEGASLAIAFPATLAYVEGVLAAPLVAPALAAATRPPPPAVGAAAKLATLPALFPAWSGDRVRSTFVEFFETKGHTALPSSSVVPHNDPTLLFANAGMNQFKPVFLGTADPASDLAKLTRATDAQKCIRAGGKHNDLDDVGKRTEKSGGVGVAGVCAWARGPRAVLRSPFSPPPPPALLPGRDVYHHTFFEMLGNWSFGDYFKAEAIEWAWELLTTVFGLDPARVYATYFGGDPAQGLEPDTEARTLWLKVLPAARVLPFGCADNFWEMGDAGPCGPCTEIHYDRIGGRDAASLVNMDDPDVLEIWNLVFIQFNREDDASLRPLPARHVDTGLGMERLTSILQRVPSNYATDVFSGIFAAVQAATRSPPYQDRVGAADAGGADMAYRVVADHIRTLSFAIADGARPGAEGREYVLRRVLRRAVRYGRETLSAPDGFFAGLVDAVVASMGGAYPELVAKRDAVHAVIADEEVSFSRTLLAGIDRYKKFAAKLPPGGQLGGGDAFLLWDSFGFPLDLTTLMAEEGGFTVDAAGFDAAMAAQRERSRAAPKAGGAPRLRFEAEATASLAADGVPLTDDAAKYAPTPLNATVLALLTPGGFVADSGDAPAGAPLGVVLDATPFYAESGGQVADVGSLTTKGGDAFAVADVQVAAGYVLHVIPPTADGAPARARAAVGDAVVASIDAGRRAAIAPNHTMTHVLNHALRAALGEGVDQKGSIVDAAKLRFDFSHSGAVPADKLAAVEAACAAVVAKGLAVDAADVPLSAAREIPGARCMFGEAYPDPVRVVAVVATVADLLAGKATGDAAAVEFCGGTHVATTADAGAFALVSEEGVAKGVRRIVALTGAPARAALAAGEQLKADVAAAAASSGPALDAALTKLKQDVDAVVAPAVVKAEARAALAGLTKRAADGQRAAAAAVAAAAADAARTAATAALASGAKFVAVDLGPGADAKAAASAWAAVQTAAPALPALFATGDPAKGKSLVLAGVPEALAKALPAGDWLKAALAPLGGKGGGKPVLAQGQGGAPDRVGVALAAAAAFAEGRLAA